MKPENEPNDDELRDALRALGDAGEGRALRFAESWRRAAARRNGKAPEWQAGWIPAAVATMVIILSYMVMVRSPKPAHTAPASMAHAQEEALPTDFLLVNANNHTDDPVARVAGEIDLLLQP